MKKTKKCSKSKGMMWPWNWTKNDEIEFEIMILVLPQLLVIWNIAYFSWAHLRFGFWTMESRIGKSKIGNGGLKMVRVWVRKPCDGSASRAIKGGAAPIHPNHQIQNRNAKMWLILGGGFRGGAPRWYPLRLWGASRGIIGNTLLARQGGCPSLPRPL